MPEEQICTSGPSQNASVLSMPIMSAAQTLPSFKAKGQNAYETPHEPSLAIQSTARVICRWNPSVPEANNVSMRSPVIMIEHAQTPMHHGRS